MTRIAFIVLGSLGLAAAACGGDGDPGGAGGATGSTTSGAGTGGGSTGTTSTGATSSTGATGSSTSSTGTGGGGCCKVKDDVPESCPGTTCGTCVTASCGQQIQACSAIAACETTLQQTFLPCMCDAQVDGDMAAEGACISTFEGSSSEAAAISACVQQSCEAECLL